MSCTDVNVRLRRPDAGEASCDWWALDRPTVLSATPWRTVRHARGQRHHPGWFWSAKAGRLLMYESRLELMQLLELEFDRDVEEIREQPFHLSLPSARGERARRHIPDFFAACRQGQDRLINVKPPGWHLKDKFRRLFEDVERLCAGKGWAYDTWSGGDRNRLLNLQWLAGYRRRDVVPATDDDLVVVAAAARTLGEATVEVVEAASHAAGVQHPRPALMHLIWNQVVRVDLNQPLQPTSEVSV